MTRVQLHKFASACMLYVKHGADSKAGAAVAYKVCWLSLIHSLGKASRSLLSLAECPLVCHGCWECQRIQALGSREGLVLSLCGCRQVNQ